MNTDELTTRVNLLTKCSFCFVLDDHRRTAGHLCQRSGRDTLLAGGFVSLRLCQQQKGINAMSEYL